MDDIHLHYVIQELFKMYLSDITSKFPEIMKSYDFAHKNKLLLHQTGARKEAQNIKKS